MKNANVASRSQAATAALTHQATGPDNLRQLDVDTPLPAGVRPSTCVHPIVPLTFGPPEKGSHLNYMTDPSVADETSSGDLFQTPNSEVY